MKRIKLFCLLLWMALIFYFSSQNGNLSQTTSDGLLFETYHWFFKDYFKMTYANYLFFSFLLRKAAHFLEYFILSLLMYSYLSEFKLRYPKIFSIALCIIYAVLDEYHQLFVEGRSFQLMDILVDTTGIIFAIFLYVAIQKIWKKDT